MTLDFSTISMYARKPLCPADTLGRPCRCDRCVAILACSVLAQLRRVRAFAGRKPGDPSCGDCDQNADYGPICTMNCGPAVAPGKSAA